MNREYCTNYAFLILRIGLSLFMLPHGISKATMLFGSAEIHFLDPIGIGETLSLALAVGAELGCSLLILIGFKIRFSVLPIILTMLIAIFFVHANDAWAIKELASLYLLGYIVLFIYGSDKYSIDKYINKLYKK